MFDRLAGIEPTKRRREDCLPLRLLMAVETWIKDSGADDLAKYASTYLAHAGGPSERAWLADMEVTSKKIADAIKALARATEAISLFVYGGGRKGAVMPVAPWNQFEKLDKPVMRAFDERAASTRWRLYSADWDHCLDGVEDELTSRA
jgi:hypothetical protein